MAGACARPAVGEGGPAYFLSPELLVDFRHRPDGEGEEVAEFKPQLRALPDTVTVDAGGKRFILHFFLEAGGLHTFHARGAHERRRDHKPGHGFPAAQGVVEGGGGSHAGHLAVVGADGVQGFFGQAVADAFGLRRGRAWRGPHG